MRHPNLVISKRNKYGIFLQKIFVLYFVNFTLLLDLTCSDYISYVFLSAKFEKRITNTTQLIVPKLLYTV